jgi:hypothetical protein
MACWFTVKLFRSRLMSFLLLCVAIIVSFSANGIESLLPAGISGIVLLLPPVQHSVYLLSHYTEVAWGMSLAVFGITLLYGLISIGLYLYVMNRRKLDAPKA